MAFIDRQMLDAVAEADRPMALDDIKGGEAAAMEEPGVYPELAQFIEGRFVRSEDFRLTEESRWLDAYRNYRGVYGPDTQFGENERCRVFIKVTKTKVLAAYGQVTDVLFANNGFPLGIQPTPVPEGVAEAVHFDDKAPKTEEGAVEGEDEEAPADPYGFAGDGREIPAGATASNIQDLLGPLKSDLEKIPNLTQGHGTTATSITFYPAQRAAQKMEKKIKDQLDECEADKHLRSAVFEMCLFGTGILAGPYSYNKEYPKWDESGEYTPTLKMVPRIEHCSIWDFYPDPDASMVSECEYVIRRRKLSRSQMRALKKRPFFRANVVDACINDGANYVKKYWEDVLRDNNLNNPEGERWEVLEWWGFMDAELAEEAGLDIPEELADQEQIQVNAWICGGRLLRLVLNPFTPSRVPYVAVPFELNPYSIFGVGVADNMSDTQALMNGFMRMAVDNGILSGNLVFEVDETNLVPGQDMKIFPGKVFRRQGGAPGQSIFGTKFPNTTQETMAMFDKARQLADESTGMPSYAHGQTGVSGMGRTAAGISMLMGASSLNIKTVIRNIDDFGLMPLGKAIFAWNMQFAFDKEIVGDLEVIARGTSSLLKNEVRQQRLMTFLQLGSNPSLAPFIKFSYIIKEIANVLDLDAAQVCNSPEEAARQAALMKLSNPEPAPGDPNAPPGGMPPGTNPADPSGAGNGNIGVGSAPTPGEQGFSGTPQAMPQPGAMQ